jgi:hypothetical protein
MQPMFRGYRPYMYPELREAGIPVDVVAALRTQAAFRELPEKYRWCLSWAYCYPYISAGRVQRQLGLTRAGLTAVLDASLELMATKYVDKR